MRIISAKGETFYTNKVSLESRRTLPPVIALQNDAAVAASNLETFSLLSHEEQEEYDRKSAAQLEGRGMLTEKQRQFLEAQREAERRRILLKEDNKREWEPLTDANTGCTYFWNHISHTRRETMPAMLDKFGSIKRLKVLQVNKGEIEALPPSMFVPLSPLERLEVKMNRVNLIPDEIKFLRNLCILRMGGNSIKKLPPGIGSCERLTELDLTDNKVALLPPELGNCILLKRLLLSHNRIRRMPSTLCRMRALEDVNISHNHFSEDDDIEKISINEGVQGFLRLLRFRHAIHLRGAPPSAATQAEMGIADSVVERDIDRQRELQELIETSVHTNSLHYFWKGITVIGPTLLSCKHLVDLRLVGNKIAHVPDAMSNLGNLRILVLQANKVESLGQNCFRGVHGVLVELDLSDNLIESLPVKFCRLRKLRTLRLQNNRLTALPKDIGNIRGLQHLTLALNLIGELPASICKLRRLEKLNLERNKLVSLPQELPQLTNLTYLSITHNLFETIPDIVGEMQSLSTFKAASNCISTIPDSLSASYLRKNLKRIWLQNNKLYDMPISFARLVKLEECLLDGNPLRSPPVELAEQGADVLEAYLKERRRRMEGLLKLLRERDFDVAEDNLFPECRDMLAGGTDYLLVQDLSALDIQVDTYINGDFYKSKDTFEDIVSAITEKRATRLKETLSCVLRVLLRALTKIENSTNRRRWYENDEIRFDGAQRPWGKRSQT